MNIKDNDITSIENLLRESLNTLRSSMTSRDANSFDETSDTIEMLISYDTKAYNNLISYKNQLKQTLKLKMKEIKTRSANCQTTISKRNYIKVNQYEHEWRYRKNYLFKIIDIFISRSILESEKPSTVIIEKVKE